MVNGNIQIGSLKICYVDLYYHKYQPIINNHVKAVRGRGQSTETVGAAHPFGLQDNEEAHFPSKTICQLLSVNWVGVGSSKDQVGASTCTPWREQNT